MDEMIDHRIAVITFQYPPVGGGYSERMTGFIKQWVRCGLSVHVITAELQGLGLPLDSESEVKGVASVTHIPTLQGRWSLGTLGKGGLFSSAWRWVNRIVPIDGQLFWTLSAAKVVERLHNEGKVGVVLTSSTPYSVHVAGLWLRKRCPSLAWVADFRDPWTTNFQERGIRRLPGSRWLERHLEQRVYDKADSIVINTHINVDDLRNSFRLEEDKVSVIQNGYDPDIPVHGEPCWPHKEGRFRLGYVGGLRGDWFEGVFFRALARLKSINPISYDRLDVLCVGSEEVVGKLPRELGVSDSLHPCGFHPRSALGGWFSSMDALLLVLPDNGGQLLGWVPQRLYLYLATGLPILCVAPEGEAAQYVRETGCGIVVSPTDTEEIAGRLKQWIEEGSLTVETQFTDSITQYSKKELAKRFVTVFESAQVRRKAGFRSE